MRHLALMKVWSYASNLLEAQTAWLTAKSDKIEAEIDAKMSEIYLQKAVGQLGR